MNFYITPKAIIKTVLEEFENRGVKKKAKQKTKEKIKVNKKEKIKHYRNCPNCGKIIPSGFRLCADCRRIKDENKKKK